MSTLRDTAMADIDTQIQQANLTSQPDVSLDENSVEAANAAANKTPEQIKKEEAAAQLKEKNAAEKAAAQAARIAKEQQQKVARGIQLFASALKTNTASANRSLGGVVTPGGIWVPFWILVFIFVILIPVNNKYTRMYWLWLSIIGHAQLSNEPTYGPGNDQGGTNLQLSTPVTSTPINTSSGAIPVSQPIFQSPVPSVQKPIISPGNYIYSINSGGEL